VLKRRENKPQSEIIAGKGKVGVVGHRHKTKVSRKT